MSLALATERLEAAARERGLAWPAGSAERLARYLDELVRMSAEVNLTGAKTVEEAVLVLGVPSLALGRLGTLNPAPRLIVDLGSGNGMPGVVAALAWPEAKVLLVERRAKKARATAACLAAVGITNVEALALDGRELLKERPGARGAAGLVLARGVGTLEEVTRIAGSWLAQGGKLVQWKQADLEPGERRAGEAVARKLGLTAQHDLVFDPPRPGPGRLVVYRR
jgi:16S rRNA (guanine527-N7)-methyltransferase